ncbi:MAG: hypothetical protein KVP17_005111 [Porospora cf. gigantea B]|uniref:uncharacterized protein n=1 Tax=Porospora cf. gigantea B TaxID=2853592 RepID=UPI003571F29D|nr:MAG: hypothetical protein KVP17_005111 [Porospora cf. gigantea B]
MSGTPNGYTAELAAMHQHHPKDRPGHFVPRESYVEEVAKELSVWLEGEGRPQDPRESVESVDTVTSRKKSYDLAAQPGEKRKHFWKLFHAGE